MRPSVAALTALAALAAATLALAGQGTDPLSFHATPAFSVLEALGGYPVETLQTGNAWRGRQSPLAASGYVGLPYVLANFQGVGNWAIGGWAGGGALEERHDSLRVQPSQRKRLSRQPRWLRTQKS